MSISGFKVDGQTHKYLYSALENAPSIPSKVSDLTNDSGYITGVADGSITEAKLDSNLQETVADVGDLKSALSEVSENYDNLYSIDLVQIGKNWYGGSAADRAVAYIPVKPSTTYFVEAPNNNNISNIIAIEKERNSGSSPELQRADISPGTSTVIITTINTNFVCIQFNGLSALSSSDFENYDVYVGEGNEKKLTAVDKIARDAKTNSNIPFSKEYYNQLYIDVCRIENGIIRNEVNNIEDIKKDVLFAVNTGADHFCVMIEMCMYNGTYYRSLTNAILDEIMTYADSLGAAIDFIKIHENTPIETISAGYTSWLNAYTEEVRSLFTVCINHNVKHLTVMNEKADVYNGNDYYSDIVSLISEVKSHGFKSGVTANSMVRSEVLTVASYDYQNVYPRIAYNADLQNDDIYDVMLKNTKLILADRQNIAIEKPVFISEIGCKPYIEYLAFPSKYNPESYWTFSTHAFRQYFYNAFKAIQNIDAVVGFCDFYNHGYLESGYIGNVRAFWMKGDVNNVIV